MAYCTQAQIEAYFGVRNVGKWADLNNDGDTVVIAARIATAIANADALIDATVRGGAVTVPFADTAPLIITQQSIVLAGCELYTARGIEDTDPDGNELHRLRGLRKDAMNVLNGIKSGRIALGLTTTKAYPDAIHEHDRPCNSQPWHSCDGFHVCCGD